MEPYETTAPQEPARKKSRWPLVAAVGGCVVVSLLIVALVAGGAYWYVSNVEEIPVTQADREAMFDVADVAAAWDVVVDLDAAVTTYTKRRYPDGTLWLEFVGEHENDTEYVWVYSSLDVESTSADAAALYHMTALEPSDFETERDEGFNWGDRSRFRHLLDDDGARVGWSLLAKRGKKVIEITVTGLVFDPDDDPLEFVEPFLERMAAYEPTAE